MKTTIKIATAALAIVVCCAAVSSATKPVAPYNPEQIKGNLRIVLLQVDKTTVFSDEGFREATPKKIHAIPGLTVIYAVEALGDDPINHWNSVETQKLVSVSGKNLEDSFPENLAGGGHGTHYEYQSYNWRMLKKPNVTNPGRTHVSETWERGLRVPSGKIDLRIVTGFNDQNEEFIFRNVPVE